MDATEYIKLIPEHGIEIVDLAEHQDYFFKDVKPEIVHWMKTHSIRDLEMLCLEMHSRGEDISELIALVCELEDIEAKLCETKTVCV